ncbi:MULTISPECIES: GNAT family N-acetyltransferase [unclassified Streptomyces]|uniref:GNAT family N-acetyltransferase n=1 Tax=Streptomyces sp. NBC_00304 TaxID=2975706 RepID=UPI002E2E3520|nr:GNAT family N-acetyltransferase [Streptomyces sp. NBC_00304]
MRPSLPTPSLHTSRLRLRTFEDADADNLFALHSNAYVLRYWDAPPWSERARAEADTRNVASARVLEKLGFVREGTLREDRVVNGEVSDSWVHGLIRREWQPSPEPGPTR